MADKVKTDAAGDAATTEVAQATSETMAATAPSDAPAVDAAKPDAGTALTSRHFIKEDGSVKMTELIETVAILADGAGLTAEDLGLVE